MTCTTSYKSISMIMALLHMSELVSRRPLEWLTRCAGALTPSCFHLKGIESDQSLVEVQLIIFINHLV